MQHNLQQIDVSWLCNQEEKEVVTDSDPAFNICLQGAAGVFTPMIVAHPSETAASDRCDHCFFNAQSTAKVISGRLRKRYLIIKKEKKGKKKMPTQSSLLGDDDDDDDDVNFVC